LFAVGLNFSGLYEIPSRIAGWGQSLSEEEGPMGAFFTGALATVVATPCTAPFMAGAVGFALSQAGPIAVGVFLALGMGLALPYLVISFLPGLYRHFPKPGPWMERLRKILAWPIYGTVAWLVWVLSHQVGGQGVWLALAALAVLGLMIWVLSRSGQAVRQGLRYSAAAGLALGLVWLTLLAGDLELRGRGAESLHLGRVETAVYDEDLIQTSRLQGRPVFLNITAAWCLTCIVQEKLVFESAEFEAFFYENNIILMTADWTNPDPEISDLLDRHQRSGIPFYLFYPGSPTDPPVELPVILTMDVIREYISPHLKQR
ncbi:MAG: thioredoxin family protein, partial [Sphingomonadales bacterium]